MFPWVAKSVEPYTPLWRDLEWKAFSDSVRPYETRFARKAFRAFVALGDVAVKTLKAGSDQESILAEVRATSLRLFARIGEQEFPLVLKYGWNRANRQIAALSRRRALNEMETRGVFDLAWPAIAEFIKTRPRIYSPMVTDTTIDQFRTVLTRLFDEGKGIAEMSRGITDATGMMGRKRATVIARSEIISASNLGAMESYRSSADVVQGKVWLATKDSRVREAHLEADGQERALEEPFEVAGVPMMQPGDTSAPPSLFVNCRCSVAPRVQTLAGF